MSNSRLFLASSAAPQSFPYWNRFHMLGWLSLAQESGKGRQPRLELRLLRELLSSPGYEVCAIPKGAEVEGSFKIDERARYGSG